MGQMQIVFLAPNMPQGPAAKHIELLAERHSVTLGLTDDRPAGEARIGGARVVAVEDALAVKTDVAVALHWKATVRLFEVNAKRFAFWVDSLANQRVQAGEQLVAGLAYDLPLDFIASAPWIAAALEQQRPDARVITARNGVTALTRSAGGDKLRVFVDDSTTQGSPGASALKRMRRPHMKAKRVEDADVVLFLDPVDGVLDAVLPAAGAGVVPVVLPAGGQSDLVTHMESGFVGEPEDLLGIASFLDRLQADAALLAQLSAGAAASAAAWPDWDEASKEFERALKQIDSKSSPDASAWPVRLMADASSIALVAQLENAALRRQVDDLRLGRSPLRRGVRKIKRSRRLTPVRIAVSRFVPARVKSLG